MDKVYLLLRKNQQTGPYTYEELLQQQLLPTDLIWVEGISTAWIYPPELTDLMAKAASSQTTTDRQTAVAQNSSQEPWYQNRKSPEAELEERALALRRRAEAAAAVAPPVYPSAPTPPRSRSHKHIIYEQEESPILLEVHTISKKSVTLPQLIAAGVITALVATGWYNREALNIVRPQQNIVTQAAAPAVFQVSLPAPPAPAAVAVADTLTKVSQAPVDQEVAVADAAAPRPKPAKEAVMEGVAAVTTVTSVAEPPVVQASASEKKQEPVTDSVVSSKVAEKKEAAVTQAENETDIEAAAPQKKKGLGQALKNIFKKKKKNDDREGEESTDIE